jgi:hypothetical protein
MGSRVETRRLQATYGSTEFILYSPTVRLPATLEKSAPVRSGVHVDTI